MMRHPSVMETGQHQISCKILLDRNIFIFCVREYVCSQDAIVNAFVTGVVTRLKITASFIMPSMTCNE